MISDTPLLDRRFSPSPDVHYQALLGEAVLLDIRSGLYFGLDEVGTIIWERLRQGATLTEVVDTLEQEFDAARDILERDTTAFVRLLQDKGLIHLITG